MLMPKHIFSQAMVSASSPSSAPRPHPPSWRRRGKWPCAICNPCGQGAEAEPATAERDDRRDLTEVEQKGEMSRNVCGPLVDKGGFGFVPPAKSGPIASAARRTESRVGLGPPGTACHCTLREAHRAFGIGHSVRRKPSEGRAISPCSSGSLPRKGRTQRGTTNHRRVGMGRTAWLKALYYDMPLSPSGSG